MRRILLPLFVLTLAATAFAEPALTIDNQSGKTFADAKIKLMAGDVNKGRVRFYRRDSDGQLEFTGENVIDHTPRDEAIRVFTGDPFVKTDSQTVEFRVQIKPDEEKVLNYKVHYSW